MIIMTKSKPQHRSKKAAKAGRETTMVGGTFCVESATGQGTSVRVDIPFARVAKAALKKSSNTNTLECP